MKTRSSKSASLSEASVPRRNLPAQTSLAAICVCLFSALLVACGGSSGSGAVSDAPASVQDDGNATQDPPAPPPPDTPAPQPGDDAAYNLGNTAQTVIDQCMSDEDKEMLTQVNDARALARTCGTVNYPATTALSWHCTLEAAAYQHSRDMGDHNFFSHTGSDGLSVGDRVTNAGYTWSAVGENIAAGYPAVDTVMTAWLGSPGHCANIMRASYTEFGAASYAVVGSDYPIYWTQVFARPRN